MQRVRIKSLEVFIERIRVILILRGEKYHFGKELCLLKNCA